MTDLSPTAQAVLDAHDNAPFENFVAADRLAVAAALRAAADQLSYCLDGSAYYVVAKDDLLAIAAELDGGAR
jgi:hypothetical protein